MDMTLAPRLAPLAGAMVLVLAMASVMPVQARSPQDGAIDEQAMRADMQRMIEQRRRELLPEYQRRVSADGRESADRWLRVRAEELGRRDGAAIRRNHDDNRYQVRETTPASAVAAGEDAKARHKRGDRSCAQVVTRQRMVPSMSGGPMQMIMVTECVPAAKSR